MNFGKCSFFFMVVKLMYSILPRKSRGELVNAPQVPKKKKKKKTQNKKRDQLKVKNPESYCTYIFYYELRSINVLDINYFFSVKIQL